MDYKNILFILLLSIFALPNLVLATTDLDVKANILSIVGKSTGTPSAPMANPNRPINDETDNPEEESMTPEELREQARLHGLEKMAEIQNRIQVRREERIGLLIGAHLERIEAYGQRMIDRNKAAIERIDSLISRLEKRLDLLEDVNPNINTVASREALAEAKIILNEARQEMDKTIDTIVDLLASENPQDIFVSVRKNIMSLTQKIRQAHAKVVEAISLLKAQPIEESTEEDGSNDD